MITIYDTTTGRFKRRIQCPVSMYDIQAKAGEAFIEGLYDETEDYADISGIDTHVLSRLPINYIIDKPIITADNTDMATVTGLPTICTVYHEGVGYPVTDGSMEFTADQPGPYQFYVDEVEYLRTEFEINAT